MRTGLVAGIVLLVAVAIISGCVDSHSRALSNHNSDFTNASGMDMYIQNNPTSRDPTYQEAVDFILTDQTDRIVYDDSFVCIDFAVRPHDNAERANLTCAVVNVEYADGATHSFNGFNTTDRGWVYFDCTGGDADHNYDKIVAWNPDGTYTAMPLVSISPYFYVPERHGKIVDYSKFWKDYVDYNGYVTQYIWPLGYF